MENKIPSTDKDFSEEERKDIIEKTGFKVEPIPTGGVRIYNAVAAYEYIKKMGMNANLFLKFRNYFLSKIALCRFQRSFRKINKQMPSPIGIDKPIAEDIYNQFKTNSNITRKVVVNGREYEGFAVDKTMDEIWDIVEAIFEKRRNKLGDTNGSGKSSSND